MGWRCGGPILSGSVVLNGAGNYETLLGDRMGSGCRLGGKAAGLGVRLWRQARLGLGLD